MGFNKGYKFYILQLLAISTLLLSGIILLNSTSVLALANTTFQNNINEQLNSTHNLTKDRAECEEATVEVLYGDDAFESAPKLFINTVKDNDLENSILFDIGFFDPKTNKEVEPAGKVAVKLDVKSQALPDEIDPDSLKLKHFIEDENKDVIKTETVADSSSYIRKSSGQHLEVGEDLVTASFITDSFSQFELSWDRLGGAARDRLQIIYIDTEGHIFNELSDEYRQAIEVANGAPSKVDAYIGLADNKKDNIAVDIDGYHYEGAYFFEDPVEGLPGSAEKLLTGIRFDELVWQKKSKWGVNRGNWIGKYQGHIQKEILNNENYELWRQPDQTNYLYLVYKPDADTVRKEEPSMKKSKSVSEQNPDGSYDITLNFSSKPGKEETRQTFDIMFLLDCSSGMDGTLEGTEVSKSKMDCAHEAIGNMVDSINQRSKQGVIDARYSVVAFSNSARWQGAWTKDPEAFKQSINEIYPNGGANYDASLREVHKHTRLGSADEYVRPNARKIVVFISCGAPTYYLDSKGRIKGNGQETSNNIYKSQQAALEHAQLIVDKHLIDDFYTVGIGTDNKLYNNLDELNQVFAKSSLIHTTAVYKAEKQEDFSEVFRDITGKVTDIRANRVVVKDTLSKYVSITTTDGLENAQITIKNSKDETVGQANIGQSIQLDDKGNSVKAVYNKSLRQVEMRFSEGYELKESYNYYLKLNVVMNPEELFELDEFSDVALDNELSAIDPNNLGIYTNDEAVIEYNRNPKGEDMAVEPFEKPVVKCKKVDFIKKFEGLEKTQINSLKDRLRFRVDVSGETFEILFNDENFEAADNTTYRYKGYLLSALPSRAQVSISEVENTQNVEFYTCATSSSPSDGKLEFKENDKRLKSFELVNTYTPDKVNILVHKRVEGNIADKKRAYKFTLTLINNHEAFGDERLLALMNDSFDTDRFDENKGEYTFELKDDASFSLNIPRGIKYIVEEESLSSDGYTTQIVVNNNKIVADSTHPTTDMRDADKDQSIVFTNSREMVPPTAYMPKDTAYLLLLFFSSMLLGMSGYFSYKKYKTQ